MKSSQNKQLMHGFRKIVMSSFILMLIILQNPSAAFSQNSVISAGTLLSGNGGIITFKSNLVNNGSFINANNEVVFVGSEQSIGGNSPVAFENLMIGVSSTTTVNSEGHTVSGVLLCNGSLNAGGNITLLSTITGTALIDGSGTGNVSGNIIMQRYLPSGFGYKFLSSPFQSAAVGEFGDDIDLAASFPPVYKYDEARTGSGWVNYALPANLFDPLAGYSVNLGATSDPKTVDVSGVVNNGSLEVVLRNHNNTYTKGFSLVGNPYPSPIDWDSPEGWTRTDIDDAVYYYSASSSDQYGGAYSTYMGGISSDGKATNIIPSMQGFFVHVADGAWPVTGTLGVTNSVRISDMGHPLLKSAETDTPSYIRIAAGYSDDSLSFDPLCIYFDAMATNGFDGQYDAIKLFNTDQNVTNFYSFGTDSARLSINALPLNDSTFCNIRLGLKVNRAGYVIFLIKDIIGNFRFNNITVTDVVTGITQDLQHDQYYKVNLIAGNYQHRFFLNLSNLKTTVADIVNNSEWFKVYYSQGVLKSDIDLPECKNGRLKIFNLAGENLFVYNIRQPGYHEFNPLLADGMYIITFESGQSRAVKKLFIQNR